MADRQLFDRSSAIPRGRYEARVRLDRAGIQPGPVRSTGNPTPLARMSRGRFEAQTGLHALEAARGAGMETAPVAMSKASLRAAHAKGLLSRPNDIDFGNYSRRKEIHHFGGRASVTLGGGAAIVVDLTDMWRLGRAFEGIAVKINRGHAIISMAINDGARTLKTGLRRKLQAWTGIRSYAETEKGMRMAWSTPATMTAVLTITDRHRRLDSKFGAAWSRADPGGTHAAWNRSQMAVGSFFVLPGNHKIPEDLLMRRVGRERLEIAPLWGPNMAREVERHAAEVQADVVMVAEAKVKRAAVRLMAAAIAGAK